jgi:phosphohistidine phosphatase
MTLYLLRHAEALNVGEQGITRDEDRPLTERGCRQAARLGTVLLQFGVTFDKVLSSPLVRARETAERVLQGAGQPAKIRTVESLQPHGSPDAAWAAISGAGGEHLLAVGHLPLLATLAGRLLGSDNEDAIWFHKATLAVLHCENPRSLRPRVRLEWMLAPALTKKLAAAAAPRKKGGAKGGSGD